MRSAQYPTLASHLWPASGLAALPRQIALALAGTVLLTLSAKAQIPFYPVPLTLQTLAVLLIGAAFGPRLAVATVGLYLLEGLVGLPVFAGAVAGPAYMAGPTGGFLVGFLFSAAFVGFMAVRGWDRSLGRLALIMTVGHLILFVFGYAWLAALIGPQKAWIGGIAPFVLGTVVKTALAVALVMASWKWIARARG